MSETGSIVEASIADLQNALSSGSITSVELVTKYLLRIFTYDCRGPCLNSIPILNPDVYDEAVASDSRRQAGKAIGLLDGIPYTLKDSMKYKGMTCATGSPAFRNLVANEDSFVAEQLRRSGAVCIGRTNTPPMMASGMHRGEYGRAGSPYNPDYLTAAFSSGSSNGSATSTAASFAAFGLGSETVSSGRSPASNNGLVAYTPSRCVISLRGIWPLYPTCDVLVPHTRTVKDMLTILDVLTVNDLRQDDEFWRQQSFVEVSEVPRPRSFLDLTSSANPFRGRRIAVPKMFIGGHDPRAKPITVSQEVIDLCQRARKDLEAMGAMTVETEFPLVANYEDDSTSGETNNVVGFKPGWNGKERGELVAYLWDDFLKSNNDPNYPGLSSVNGSQMFPRPQGYIPDRYMETKNFMNYPNLVEIARKRPVGRLIWDIDGIAEALQALEAQRNRDLEDWMNDEGIDFVMFPANGDVGKADLDHNDESARHALQNGVKYSIGNRAIRHMGVPTASVCMGILPTSNMPVNITFAGKHGQDSDLMRYAYAYEQYTSHRMRPPMTPAIGSDRLPSGADAFPSPGSTPPTLIVKSATKISQNTIKVNGSIEGPSPETIQLEAFVDGRPVSDSGMSRRGAEWTVESDFTPFEPEKPLYGGIGLVVGNVNIIILARSSDGVAGKLVKIDQKAPIVR